MSYISKYFSEENRSNILLKVACLFWLIAKLMSWRIWTTYRLYPTAPIFNDLSNIPPIIHSILFIISLLLITCLLFKQNRFLLAGLLIIEILSCLLDQTRLQPWEYQYIFIAFVFIINFNKQQYIIPVLAFIMASTYFYSGCSKFNSSFLQEIWTKSILHSFFKISMASTRIRFVYYSGYFLALYEITCGAALLFPKTQKVAARALILMHFFILIVLGPWALNYNQIVWPWNIAMIPLLHILFLKDNVISITPAFSRWNILVFILWGILPAFSFLGYWDKYLSSNLYSGNSSQVIICIKDTTECRQLHSFWKVTKYKFCDGQATIDVYKWALAETNVTPYPQLRVYKLLEEKLQQQYPAAQLGYYTFIKGLKQ